MTLLNSRRLPPASGCSPPTTRMHRCRLRAPPRRSHGKVAGMAKATTAAWQPTLPSGRSCKSWHSISGSRSSPAAAGRTGPLSSAEVSHSPPPAAKSRPPRATTAAAARGRWSRVSRRFHCLIAASYTSMVSNSTWCPYTSSQPPTAAMCCRPSATTRRPERRTPRGLAASHASACGSYISQLRSVSMHCSSAGVPISSEQPPAAKTMPPSAAQP
mmetsp:Transcript_14129/g.45149  ORF Transcript_14129/g.45149 Transcript_14129/m.45149 type:complete len:215 (-) Transcript_14129:40-684(-)